jgi:threonine/homoserine/homoserine lactone efflux protein
MGPYLQGVLLGLTFAVLLGPAFFSLIQTSIHRGFRSGVLLASGIFISDVFALILCYFGASQILGTDPRQNTYFSITGGIILIIFGTYNFSRKVLTQSDKNNHDYTGKSPRFYIYIIKGFLLNAFNPGMWFIWITIVVSISANYGVNNRSVIIFLAGILSAIFGTDILKCFVSNQIKYIVNNKVMTWMNRIVGIVLIIFGTYLIINVLVDLERFLLIYDELFKKNK